MTLSAVVQDALRDGRAVHRRKALEGLQGCWSRKAKELGILTGENLRGYCELECESDAPSG